MSYGGRMPEDEPTTEYRSREGPDFLRPGSPPWDTTTLRVRRDAKERLDVLRLRWSRGRVVPLWEAFDRLVRIAEVLERQGP